jgi:hypothetical protein
LIAVVDDAVLAVPRHRPAQHGALDVGAQAGQVVDAVAVIDAHHVLFDDRPFVEIFGYVMCRCATSLTPRSLARRYGAAPMNAGRNE